MNTLDSPVITSNVEVEEAKVPRPATKIRIREWLNWWPVRDVLVPFVATRLMLSVVGCLALALFYSLPANPIAWEIKGDGNVAPVVEHPSARHYPLVNIWSRWDSAFFHSIAESGYNYIPGQRSNAAFFPAYPLAMRAAHALLPGDTDVSWFVSGILVSNTILLVGLCYFVLLVRLDWDNATAGRAALYTLLFPTTLFFSAVYSEALFFAVTVASFYHARRNQWIAACGCAAIAVLTRAPGVLLAVPLLVEYLHQRNYKLRAVRLDLAAFALIPASFAGLLFYFHLSTGNMFAIQDAQAAWGDGWGQLTFPWMGYMRSLNRPFHPVETMDFIFAASALVLVTVAALRLRPSYGVYAVISYWFITAWGTLDSVPRYMLPIFPMFMLFAMWGKNPVFDRFYVVCGSGLAALFMLRFALWQWVA